MLEEFYLEQEEGIKLSKTKVLWRVVSYFKNPGMPETIYIVLGDSQTYRRGDVISSIHDVETPCDFLPVARIDELVLNIPTKAQFRKYFEELHQILDPEDITWEVETEFWQNYRWKLAEELGGKKIIWER